MPLSSPLQRQIITCVVLFLLLGQVMLFSATGVPALQRYGSEFYFVSRQALTALAGFFLMILLSKVKVQFWYRIAYGVFAVELLLVAATFFPGIGHHAQGATRWIRFQGFLFQPSELSKIAVPLFVGRVLSDYKMIGLTGRQILARGGAIALLLGMIIKQPDLGTTTLLVLTMLGMFFIAGLSLMYLLTGFVLGGVGFAAALLHMEYRRKRLFAFLNPWADPQGSGFQSIQSFLSFHSGGILGSGLGNGNAKLFYLPEVHTDFIFSLIGEELGFVGAIIVVAVFAYFSYLLFRTSFKAADPFSCYFAFGLAFLLTAQVAVNLGGVTGLLPVKGLPLPFISWGRSALVVNLAMVGILLNIVRQSGMIASE
ncbi:putative lipid II flippase FtsW [bacterium]|nr:putative lipid II flippase FtsW [bacterium]